jgi:serine/threonine protein kinase
MHKNILPAGCLLSGYRVEKAIGGGGFSLVYLAHDLHTQEEVVIKEYLPPTLAQRLPGGRVEPLSDDTAPTYRLGIKRVFEEASALAKVNHPNIVRVTNVFRANNTVYIVMRHEAGKDLRWYIKRHSGRLTEKFIRTVFPPLLEGLRELHAREMLHLDIKPANIFLRPGGNPLLLDFGAAQHAAARSFGPGTLTLGFAPPEQHNKGHLGPWTDMYAIGASMWACMSGKAPPPATERAVKDKYKAATRTYGRWYSRQLLEAIDWCMQLNQEQRPQSAQALLDFLSEAPDIQTDAGLFDTAYSYLGRLWLKRPGNKA